CHRESTELLKWRVKLSVLVGATTDQKYILDLLNKQEYLSRLNGEWYFKNAQHRQWLSKKASFLLTVWRQAPRKRIRSIVTIIHYYLITHHLLNERYSLGLRSIGQMMKLEYVMTRSSIEYKLFVGSNASTTLSDNVMMRILTGKRVANPKPSKTSLMTTVRQQRYWRSGFAIDQAKLRRRVKDDIEELAPTDQIKIIHNVTKDLSNATRADAKRISAQTLQTLHTQIDNKHLIRSRPFCWLLQAWLYHLIKNGGKFKSSLRLKTVSKYVNAVCAPFITEFSGCDPEKMNEVDWAEKLNLVIESIHSPQSKAFVAYFAEFLVESELVPNLCLSDIDVPVMTQRRVGHDIVSP
ncbi:hypothetical protein HGP28_18885, partial [Vibrio sp. SM6]